MNIAKSKIGSIRILQYQYCNGGECSIILIVLQLTLKHRNNYYWIRPNLCIPCVLNNSTNKLFSLFHSFLFSPKGLVIEFWNFAISLLSLCLCQFVRPSIRPISIMLNLHTYGIPDTHTDTFPLMWMGEQVIATKTKD